MFSLLRLLIIYCMNECIDRPSSPPVTEDAIARLEKALELEASEEGDRTS